MSADKIGPQHRGRKAMLYVRQSSAHQVQHNRESQALQYAMRERLAQLGWSQVEVIDEDLGCSAAGGTPRAGFERMVAEVCMGIFPNTDSIQRLIGAVLLEANDEWQLQHRYMQIEGMAGFTPDLPDQTLTAIPPQAA